MSKKRVIIIDMIAQYIAKKFLPHGTPDFPKISDMSLLHIIAWAQEWSAEEVYDTAFEQVFPASQVKDAKQDFGDWYDSCESPSLPIVVRTELIRAFRIHEANGRMDVLRLGAWAQHQCKRIMWIGFALMFLFLIT